jgi:hypothetical protein
MSNAALFELASWTVSIGFILLLTAHSVRVRRVTPILAMAIGLGAIFWMEAPFDWATWCQFNPELPRIPAWGPLGMTAGGLPWVAPFGYVMYCAIPPVFIAWVSPKIAARLGTNPIRTLLLFGFGFSFFYDIAFQQLGSRMEWWRYARGYDGLTLFAGTPYLLTLTIPVFMATLYALCAYLVGRVDTNGHTFLEVWSRRRSAHRPGPWLVFSTVVVTQLIFAILFLPNMIAKLANVAGTQSSLPLFAGLEPQEASEPSQFSTVGGLLLLATLLGLFGLAVAVILKRDPQSRATLSGPAPSGTVDATVTR